MMISPESYIASHKNKSYLELLIVRDELINYIPNFEERKELEQEVLSI